MLHLHFRAGSESYLIQAKDLVEVLPLVQWTVVPQVCPGVLGIINYHGVAVPLLDLGELLHGAATPARRGARILLVRHAAPALTSHLLGLAVEQVVGFVRLRAEDFAASPIRSSASFVGEITSVGGEIVHRVTPEQMLESAVIDRLLGFPLAREGG